MFKLIAFLGLLAVASAGVVPALSPVVGAVPAPIVTARSSQVIARNYNTFAYAPAAPVAAPLAYAAPALSAPLAYSTHPIAPIAYPAAYAAAVAPAAPVVVRK